MIQFVNIFTCYN